MSISELDEARERVAAEQQDEDTASVAERAEDEVPEAELFPMGSIEGDPKITWSMLLKRGRPVEVTSTMRAAEVGVRNGQLLDPEKVTQVLVTVVPEQAIVIYKRETIDGPVKGYKIRQPLRPTYVQEAGKMFTREDVLDILSKVGVPDTADVITELLGEE